MKQLNKLSNSNKILLYDYLCYLEKELKDSFGKFNIEDDNLCAFLDMNSIFIGSYTETNKKKIRNYKYFLLSNLRKPDKFKKIPDNDDAYLHLKHIRNAIAHGNIVSVNKLNFTITDYSEQGNLSAMGKISCKLFYDLIDVLLKTKTI